MKFTEIIDSSTIERKTSQRGEVLTYQGEKFYFRSVYTPKRGKNLNPYRVYYCSENRKYCCKVSIKEYHNSIPVKYFISSINHDHISLREKKPKKKKKRRNGEDVIPIFPIPISVTPLSLHTTPFNNSNLPIIPPPPPHHTSNNDSHTYQGQINASPLNFPNNPSIGQNSDLPRLSNLRSFNNPPNQNVQSTHNVNVISNAAITAVEPFEINFSTSVLDTVVSIGIVGIQHLFRGTQKPSFRIHIYTTISVFKNNVINHPNGTNKVSDPTTPVDKIVEKKNIHYSPHLIHCDASNGMIVLSVKISKHEILMNRHLRGLVNVLVELILPVSSPSETKGNGLLKENCLSIIGPENALLSSSMNSGRKRKRRKVGPQQNMLIRNGPQIITSPRNSFVQQSAAIHYVLPSTGSISGGDYVDVFFTHPATQYMLNLVNAQGGDQNSVENTLVCRFGENVAKIVHIQTVDNFSKARIGKYQSILQNKENQMQGRSRQQNNYHESEKFRRLFDGMNCLFYALVVSPKALKPGLVDIFLEVPFHRLRKSDAYYYRGVSRKHLFSPNTTAKRFHSTTFDPNRNFFQKDKREIDDDEEDDDEKGKVNLNSDKDEDEEELFDQLPGVFYEKFSTGRNECCNCCDGCMKGEAVSIKESEMLLMFFRDLIRSSHILNEIYYSIRMNEKTKENAKFIQFIIFLFLIRCVIQIKESSLVFSTVLFFRFPKYVFVEEEKEIFKSDQKLARLGAIVDIGLALKMMYYGLWGVKKHRDDVVAGMLETKSSEYLGTGRKKKQF